LPLSSLPSLSSKCLVLFFSMIPAMLAKHLRFFMAVSSSPTRIGTQWGAGQPHTDVMYTALVATLFISDLHLNGAQPEITAQFVAFLRGEARQAEQLYILGDLFEFWVGDDDPDPTYQQVQHALRALSAAGVPCSVMHGNRDFLLGQKFCARTGCQLIDDGIVINLYGQRVLLTHGDVLCTDDHSYQRLRRIVRNPLVQWMFMHLPLSSRERIATRVRTGSQLHTQRAATSIMDVNSAAVQQAFVAANVQLMIHGHTHRPGIHHYPAGVITNTRIVLGDWYSQGSVLRWSADGYELSALPRSGAPE
jgi:UDP-2,3-diacylglucosamine hydrolase